MKRPTIALLSLLAMLTLGLVAIPRSCDAGSLGELAFAIQIEETSAGDPIVCPMVCCPFSDEDPQCADAEPGSDGHIELNAADTNDDPQLAADDSEEFDYDSYYYDEYGYEYGDEYSEEYGEEYHAETADEQAVDESTTEEADSDIELNAASYPANESLTEESVDDYYGDYGYDYTDFGFDYEGPAASAEEPTDPNCNDVVCDPVGLPCTSQTQSQDSTDELAVDTATSEHDHEEPAYVDPYDQYGSQVGDEYWDDEYDYDEYEHDYYSEQYYDDHVQPAQEAAEPAQEDTSHDSIDEADELAVDANKENQGEDSDHVDQYGSQVGDEYWGDEYDYDEYDYDDYDYDGEQYYDDYVQPTEEAADPALEDDASGDPVVEADDTSVDEYYEDYYYEDYYGEDFDSAELGEGDSYEEDYERYYSEEYYDQLDEAATPTDEAASEGEEFAADDYTSDYDEQYDETIYGDTCFDQTLEVAESDADEGWTQQAYLEGQCIQEMNAEIVDDLPWADVIEDADVAQIDVPANPAGELSAPGASEYGSDYAEEYYEEFYEGLETELVPLHWQQDAPAVQTCEEIPTAAVKTLHNTFDVSEFAVYCGGQVASWTEKISVLGKSLRTACRDIDLNTNRR